MTTPTPYNAKSIQVLTGLEPVRMRPAMFIGSTGVDGLHHCLTELIDNAVDEVLAGACTTLSVRIHTDGSCTVEDDGRGIPTDLMADTGRSALEVVMTTLHSGGKFGGDAYKVSGGLHGVGLSCVNALSSYMSIDVWRDGVHHQQRFERGTPVTEMETAATDRSSGTRILFLPDSTIFSADARWIPSRIGRRLRELAYLNPGLTVRFTDEREGIDTEHRFDGGLSAFVEALNKTRLPIQPKPIALKCQPDGILIHVAMQWTSLYAEEVKSYVNTIWTADGGTHVSGLQRAISDAVRQVASEREEFGTKYKQLRPNDTREGLTAVLSLMMRNPEFQGQTKGRLMNDTVDAHVHSAVRDALVEWMRANPPEARSIIEKALTAARARLAANMARTEAEHISTPGAIDLSTYRKQFGVRSLNWHDSAVWLTDDELLAKHAEMADVAPDAKLLDVCCGSGVVGHAFRNKVSHITGLDITPEMVALARTRLDEVVLGNVFDMPFETDAFDIVSNREVMHLFPHPERMLSEVYRVLKPGGQFVFGQIVPFSAVDAPWMNRIFRKKQPLLHHMFLHEDLLALLEGAGFGNIHTTEINVWENIDVWINTVETSRRHRHEIKEHFFNAPKEVTDVHPFEIKDDGTVMDLWRWVIYACNKPGTQP
jgi:DNA gyrase subunit B